jgi:hypothetical protein
LGRFFFFFTVSYTKKDTSVLCRDGVYTPPEPLVLNCTLCLEEYYSLNWLPCSTIKSTQIGVYVLDAKYEWCVLSDSWTPQNQTWTCSADETTESDGAKTASFICGLFAIGMAYGLASPSCFRSSPGRIISALTATKVRCPTCSLATRTARATGWKISTTFTAQLMLLEVTPLRKDHRTERHHVFPA